MAISKDHEVSPFKHLYAFWEEKDREVFKNVEIDPTSLKLLEKGPAMQRYAFVGVLLKDKLKVYCRPSFSDQLKADKAVKDGIFTADRIAVITDNNFTGMVHRETVAQLLKEEEENNGRDEANKIRRCYMIGFSAYKLHENEHKYHWYNRSALNVGTFFDENQIAVSMGPPFYISDQIFNLFCIDYCKPCNIYHRDILFQTNAYTMERSIPETVFKDMINSLSKKLKNHDQIIDEEYNYSFLPERKWESIFNAPSVNEQRIMVEKMLLDTIYIFAAKKISKGVGLHADKVIKDVLEKARDYYGLHIDFDWLTEMENMPKNSTGEVYEEFKTAIEMQSTSLILFVKNGYIDIVNLLLSHHAKIDTADISRKTALFYAIENKDFNIANLLINNGADLTLVTNISVQQNRSDIINNILQWKKNVEEHQVDQESKSNQINLITRLTNRLNESMVMALESNQPDIVNQFLINDEKFINFQIANLETWEKFIVNNNQNSQFFITKWLSSYNRNTYNFFRRHNDEELLASLFLLTNMNQINHIENTEEFTKHKKVLLNPANELGKFYILYKKLGQHSFTVQETPYGFLYNKFNF